MAAAVSEYSFADLIPFWVSFGQVQIKFTASNSFTETFTYKPAEMITMSDKMKKDYSNLFYKNEGIPTPKATLHLNLKKKWFDMIASGEKKEEYREIKPYWNRVFGAHICIKGRFYHPTDVAICFSNGYAKDRRQMTVECLGLFQRAGNPEWGADPNELYHTLLIGNIISKNFK